MRENSNKKINIPDPAMGPIRFTAASFKNAISGLGALIKKPKMLMITIFISVLQTVLSYLKILMPSSVAVAYASFFTFAQGGMYAGLIGAVGGIIGKGIYAWFINTLIFSALTGKKKKANVEKEPKIKGEFVLSLAGTGIALIAYNFLTGNAALENSVIGVTAVAACVRALKRKNGFLIGFICSFTRGRMTRNRAGKVIKGMIAGFLIGVLSSLKFSGILCYIVGAVMLMLALAFMIGRKRAAAAVTAMLLVLSAALPVSASSSPDPDEWLTPQEAYGIPGDTLSSYMELANAVSADPPASMELTLVAVGARNFEESLRLDNQQVVAENGESGVFNVNAAFSEFSFDSTVSLHMEEDGWYADSSTSYVADNSWTNDETEEGTYKDYQKCCFSSGHLGAANYLYEQYLEPGKFYMEINIPFAYGDVLGESQASSATQIFARVDRVKRTEDEGGSGQVSGIWELKGTETYIIRQVDSSVSTAEKFTGQWTGNDLVDEMDISVTGNTITYIRTRAYSEGEFINDLTASFGEPPSQLKAFDTLRISVSEEGTFYDSGNNSSREFEGGLACAGFLPGTRSESFSTRENDSDLMAYPFGAGLQQIWFENADGFLQSSIPPGQTPGEMMTLELAFGVHEPYDTSQGRIWEIPVIAYLYEWKSGGVLPPESEEEEEGTGDETAWGADIEIGGDWDEHANGEETGVISALSALSAIAGAAAAAAAAGGFGGGPGGGSGGYIKRNEEDDLVVRDPVTGEESLYVINRKTGLYTNPLTGADYTEEELTGHIASRAENTGVLRQDYEKAEQAKHEQREDNQKLSQARNELELEKRMNDMKKSLGEKGEEGDEIAAAMAAKLDQLHQQKKATGSINQKDLERFRHTYGKWTRGDIAGSSGLPKAENEWEIFKQGMANTGEEIARGDSWKAIGLKVAVGLLTGSLVARAAISAAAAAVAEAGLEIAQAGYVMKDYVDKGGKDWKEGAQQAITKTLVGEAIGRTFGLGLKGIGMAASKTGQILSKSKAGKYIVDGIVDSGEAAGKVLNANIGDVPKVIRQLGKESGESAVAAKAANAAAAKLRDAGAKGADSAGKQAAGSVESAGKQAAGSMESAGKQAAGSVESAGKQAAGSMDDAAKQAAPGAEDLAKKTEGTPKMVKDTDAYKKVSKEIDDSLNKSKETAAEKINKFRSKASEDPELAARQAAHEEGGRIGIEKVERLENARKELAGNPDSPELKKEFENAVRDVQKNKHAQKVMNEKELVGNDTRQGFNDYKVKKDAVISLNTSERVALKLGFDPKNVSNVQATNSMDTGGVGDIAGVAGKRDFGTPSGEAPRTFSESDVDANGLEKKGGEKISIDLDQTYRVEITMKDGTVISKDLPASEVRMIQNEEAYKAWNNGELPLKKDGTIDHEAVKKFADDMDYTVVDARSPDAYGIPGDLQQALKNDGTVREYSDPEAVSKTISYKSDEWLERGAKKADDGDIINAEGDVAEGIRQSTKQFDSQLVYQVKAINTRAGTTRVVIPEKLAEGMSVLKQIGHGPGKISPAEAEAVLNEMGTNTESILKLCADETEFINRLIVGGLKNE